MAAAHGGGGGRRAHRHRLEGIPAQTLSWADFKRAHPRGDVLSRDTGHDRDYGTNPYEGYDARDNKPFLFDGEADARLPAMQRVVAFQQDGGVVVPFSALERDPVVELDVAERPVVVLFKDGVVSALDAAAITRSRDVAPPAPSTAGSAAARSPSCRSAMTASATASRLDVGHHRPRRGREACGHAAAPRRPRPAVLVRAGRLPPGRADRHGDQEDPGPAETSFGPMTPIGSFMGHLVYGLVLGLAYDAWPLA